MMISDDKRRDFEDRKLDNVKRQVAQGMPQILLK